MRTSGWATNGVLARCCRFVWSCATSRPARRCAKGAGEGNRFVITARPYAWEDAEQKIVQVPFYPLAEFDDDQIETFIARWYAAITAAGWAVSDAEEKTRSLQGAARGS